MDRDLRILLAEYSQTREMERTIRILLYRINGFAATLISGLLLGIVKYEIEPLALAGPFLFFLVGLMWSSEAIRLLKLTEHARVLEREMRRRLDSSQNITVPGLEDSIHPHTKWWHYISNNKILAATALFYLFFYIMFFIYLVISSAPQHIKKILIAVYLLLGAVLWLPDL